MNKKLIANDDVTKHRCLTYSWNECAGKCQEKSGCSYWVWHTTKTETGQHECLLLNDKNSVSDDEKYISGSSDCYTLDVPLISLGCWGDSNGDRIFTGEEAVTTVIECAEKYYHRNWAYFGVQYHTQCFAGEESSIDYQRHGQKDNCVDGKGGSWSMNIYKTYSNIALNKETVQSSSKNNSLSSNAVDGNINGDLNNGGTCSITLDGESRWWAVDLGHISIIQTLFVYRRTDGADTGKKLNNLEVRIADSLPNANSDFDQMELCAHYQVDQLPAKRNISCHNHYTTGKVVILKSLNDDEIEICEVVIQGYVLSYTLNDFLLDANKKNLSDFQKDADGCLGVEQMLAENSGSSMVLSLTLETGFETAIIWISSENVLYKMPDAECATQIPAFLFVINNESPPRTSRCRLEKVKENMFCFKCNCNTAPCTKLNYYITQPALLENPKICAIDVYIHKFN